MEIGRSFGTHPDFKTLYYVYLLIPSVVVFAFVILPVLAAAFLYLPRAEALVVARVRRGPCLETFIRGDPQRFITRIYSSSESMEGLSRNIWCVLEDEIEAWTTVKLSADEPFAIFFEGTLQPLWIKFVKNPKHKRFKYRENVEIKYLGLC